MLLAGAAVIGLAPILVRFAQAGPAAAGFWRLAFSLPMLAALTRRTSDVGRPSRLTLLAGFAFALDLAFHGNLNGMPDHFISYLALRRDTSFRFLVTCLCGCLLWPDLLQSASPNKQADTVHTSRGDLRLTPLYHGSVMLEFAGLVIHVDPWSQADYSPDFISVPRR